MNDLLSINVDENNTEFVSIDGILINREYMSIVQYPCGKIGHYDIPDNVTSINSQAFYDCSNPISLSIPTSFSSIAENNHAWLNIAIIVDIKVGNLYEIA